MRETIYGVTVLLAIVAFGTLAFCSGALAADTGSWTEPELLVALGVTGLVGLVVALLSVWG